MKREDIRLISKDKVDGIQDDEFFRIENEFDQIRSSLGMYISKGGTEGALHLEKEIFNNALDECNSDNPHWKGRKKEISVEYYESERRFVTCDNGRGMPADIVRDAIMHKHVSTKTVGMSTIRTKKHTGLNGVGLTVTAALTDYMSLTTYRGDKYKEVELLDGVLKDHPITVNKKESRTGTKVEIIPSEKYLGKIELPTSMVEDYLRHMSYIIERDVSIKFTGEDNSGKKMKHYHHTYHSKGLSSAVEYLSSSLEFSPVQAKYSCDDYDITVSFSYDKSIDDTQVVSYCNYVITSEGGCHEIAATRAISEYFTREAKRQEPNSKYEVTPDDCRRGLIIAVNLEHVEPKFEGQHKTRVSNNEVITDGKRGLVNALFTVLNNNPIMLKKIITYLRQMSRIRQEANKIKGISTKRATTFIEDSKISKYFTVSNRNSTGYKELFIAEGDSACGALLNARNPQYQAIFTVQGVTDNVHDLSLTQLLQKQMFKDLVTILGTGIGKGFDITKLRYDKLIICTDSDVDGMNITSLLLCFFFIFMPEIITSGKLYKAMPPLYLIDTKSIRKYYNGREWLYDKQEYYKMINTMIVGHCRLAISANGKRSDKALIPMSKKEAMSWLSMNSEYQLELDNLGKKSSCAPEILEQVCFLKSRGLSKSEFKKAIEKIYPEMEYEIKSSALVGSYDGHFASLICDSLFDKSAQRFMSELHKNSSPYIWYANTNDKNDKYREVTIGQFYSIVGDMFDVKISERYKGLGEADADLLFRTTTNPKFRKLLKMRLRDVDKAAETFELLHGKSAKLREDRRNLLDSVQLSYADIDN